MHGKILNWNGAASSGVVVTEGGERYAFGPTDFKSAAQPRAGLKVDFVPEGERAGEIYVTGDGVLGGAEGAGSNAREGANSRAPGGKLAIVRSARWTRVRRCSHP